jgi:beta-xylosidase
VAPFALGGVPALAKSIAALAASALSMTVASPAPPPVQPLISHDFADPSVLRAGSAYYAYSTMSRYGTALWHVPVARATHDIGHWTVLHDAMPQLPAWVDHSAPGDGDVWAPDVSDRRDRGYLLYFTARSAVAKIQCIGAATAASPTGPFVPAPHPVVCRPRDTNLDAIDPTAFTDTDGARYLLYSSGAPRTAIWLQRTSRDGLRLRGAPRKLIVADRDDEAHIVEAPALVRHGRRYVLFYSGNAFSSGRYFVNYATASSLHERFDQHAGQLLNTSDLNGAYQNPGGADLPPAPHDNFLVFHAYTSPSARSLFAVGLRWDNHDHPVLHLSTRRAPRVRPLHTPR